MEEEISLKEILTILWEGKITIISVTIVVTLLAAIFSNFFLTPKYETSATVLINSVQQNETGSSAFTGYLNEAVSPQIFMERVASLEVLRRVKDKTPTSERELTSYQNNLSVELTEDSNLIKLTFTGTNPAEIQETLTSIVEEAKIYTEELISDRLITLSNQFREQAEIEKQSLDQLLAEYNQMRVSEGLPSIVVMDAVTSNSNQFILNSEDLEEFQNLDRTKQVEFEKINSKIRNLTSLYNQYYSSYEEGRSLADFYKVDNKFSVLSQPFEPINPVSPNVLLNTAIAFVIGLMVSVGLVFFRAYWRDETSK
ncbi:Wzz/FepE/Etk N-terminal domain-containing protein [Aquibacillus albus]|uniref:Capsular polysaccharide biosynthesis protein n=1 Tax=Aquibacillus albus TaxID=1168171 RepID=A0ABS2MZN9_9BACI|nr:Wzz/FepE/Etk N-terminal domain-containing protein [Aquibacillus albus]MBM7571370.1 capsular polysaccharide biosynthesis protein [Aquibacillus albus]